MTKKTALLSPPPTTARKPMAATPRTKEQPLTTVRTFGYLGWIAASLAFLLYANTLGHGYCLDDAAAIYDNSLVKGGLSNIGTIFSSEYRAGYELQHAAAGSLYRPLSLAVLAIEWQITPDNPSFYHFVNIFLYALLGLVLWRTWRRILHRYPPNMVAAAVCLFMAHPAHTEVVANIKSLDEILALLFSTLALSALWRFLEGKQTIWLAAALVSYTAALFSKENAITFLAIFPMAMWFFGDKKWTSILQTSLFFLATAALFLGVRAVVLGAQSATEPPSVLTNFIAFAPSFSSRLASACMMGGYYLKTLLFPHPLVSEFGFSQTAPVTFSDPRAALGLMAFLAMFCWAAWGIRSKQLASFAILFFLTTFSLCSNVFFLIGTQYGERLLFMPSFGVALALAWGLWSVFPISKKQDGHIALFWPLCAGLIALYGLKTIERNPDWKNDFTLATADIKTSPNSAHLNFNLGKQYLAKGFDKKKGAVLDSAQIQKAIDCFSKSLSIFDNNYDALGERGWAYVRLKKYDLAYADYTKALELKPDNSKVMNALGYLCRNHRNEPDRAETLYRKAIATDAQMLEPRINLGALLATKGQLEEALQVWNAALVLAPEDTRLKQYIERAAQETKNKAKKQ